MSERELTDAEAFNTNEPLNPSGKPIQDGTDLHEHDHDETARERIDESARDDVWSNAETSTHDPMLG